MDSAISQTFCVIVLIFPIINMIQLLTNLDYYIIKKQSQQNKLLIIVNEYY